MTFQLDTTGQVPSFAGSDTALNFYTWERLDAFTQGYIEALFAELRQTTVAQECEQGGWVLGFSDLAPEALARVIADCASRQNDYGFGGVENAKDGAGFWGRRQASASRSFPPMTVQLEDDCRVRFA